MSKATIPEIRARFDADVERFSNLNTGQVSTVDATLCLDLITESAARLVPHAQNLLDIGCGAGNYTLMMLAKLPGLSCTLLDLSRPMLDRAAERVAAVAHQSPVTVQDDIRTAPLPENHFDIILAGTVLHHLRDDADWEQVFAKLYRLLKPGGCLLISDLVAQETDALTDAMWLRYAAYLENLGGKPYAENVLAYIDREDSPRAVTYQLDLLRRVGFRTVELLHKHLCFAAFGGQK
ncbi:MAG: methyltransferase domain-containing protein [Verrucomicrobiota bacterium]|jgi:tRNA (cmo5U34)-methyltransferase|nr:methyltransferase domain-containing protein [Verrucomicrobiota bacterium]